MERKDIDPGLTRREVLKRALLGGAGLALTGGMGGLLPRVLAAGSAGARPGATAKAVIQIWMWGGPCHIDTFDPKPGAGRDYTGPLDRDIPTNVKGIRINAGLPLLAQQADKYAILRSVTHNVFAHETASYIVQTGATPGGKRIVRPSVGAVVNLFKGRDHGYRGRTPPYVVLTRPLGRFSEVGILGLRYKPFVTGGDPNQRVFAVEGIVARGVTRERQEARRKLLHELDALGRALPDDPRFRELDRAEDEAYEMILGDAGKIFDLSEEKTETRERYGRSKFGQSCLMARRLVEAGVPYVSINYEGWDTHKRHFETMTRKLPELDRGFSALLEDLAERGLLDSTIVWWGGEFGRTPKVMWQPPWNGGRNHWGRAFCTVLAGGGIRGGRVVGATDATGENVVERPVHPRTVIAGIYELLGIDGEAPLPNPRALPVNVLPPPPKGVPADDRLREILP